MGEVLEELLRVECVTANRADGFEETILQMGEKDLVFWISRDDDQVAVGINLHQQHMPIQFKNMLSAAAILVQWVEYPHSLLHPRRIPGGFNSRVHFVQ